MYRPGAAAAIVLDFIYIYSSQIQTDKPTLEPKHVWDAITAADINTVSGACLFFCELLLVSAFAHCLPTAPRHTHSLTVIHTPTLKALTFPPSYHGHKSTGPKIVTAGDVHTSQTDKSGKGAFPLSAQWKCK